MQMNKNVGIIGAIAVIAVVGYWYFNPNSTPSALMPTGAAGVPAGEGTDIVQITVPELTGNAILGEKIFNLKCAACHGQNAVGTEGVAPPLVHKVYEPNHHGETAFVLAAKNGVHAHHWSFGNMPPVDGVTDGDVKMVVAYIRALQQANGIR